MKGGAQVKVSKGSFTTCPTYADEFPTLQKALIHSKKDHPGSCDDAFATQWTARGCKVCQGCGYPYGQGGRHTCKAVQPSVVKSMTRKPPRTPATLTPLPNGNMPHPAWVRYPYPQTTARPAPLHAQSPDVVHQ